jgi:PAS domain S-box-containing protein
MEEAAPFDEKSERESRILQSVLDSMDQGVVVADSHGTVLLCNPAADRIAGAPLSSLPLPAWVDHLELLLADGVTPYPPHELPLARALRGEETPELLMCLRGPDHSGFVYVRIRGRPLRDQEGRPWGGVAVFRDVTKDIQAERVLRDYAHRLEDIYHNAPCGYHSVSPDGTFLLVNDTELSWLGYRREELVGRRKFVELLTAESVRTFHENFPLFLERGWVRNLEFELVRRDGSVLDVVLNATAVYDAENRLVMSRSTLVDNTERKRAERRISARHSVVRVLAESRSLVEAAPRVLESLGSQLGWDLATLWSVEPGPGTPRLTASWSATGPSGAPDAVVPDGALIEAVAGTVRRALDQAGAEWVSPVETGASGPSDGAATLHTGCLVPIRHHGAVLGMLALFSRSPRERDELLMGMLENLAEQFSQFVEARRMQERVIQSERLASIGVLSAGVAHEINNPLAYVSNNLAVLDRDCRLLLELASACEAIRPAVEVADRAAAERIRQLAEELGLDGLRERLVPLLTSTRQGLERMAATVRNLRGFARLDQAVIDRVNLRDCVASTVGLIESRLSRAGIQLRLAMDDTPPVECAPAQINQMFLSLLENAIQAIQATGRGDGRIEVSAQLCGVEVVVEVSDNGCGIPAEFVGRVFDPFFTTRGVGEGSGLGLSICHGIINDHGGRIEVETTVGQGARFRVFLPVTRKGDSR